MRLASGLPPNFYNFLHVNVPPQLHSCTHRLQHGLNHPMMTNLVLSGVVPVDGLLVLAVIVTKGAAVALRCCEVILDPLPVVLHGKMVLPLSRLVLGLGFKAAHLAWPARRTIGHGQRWSRRGNLF